MPRQQPGRQQPAAFIAPFSGAQLESLCQILGATDDGLTGAEIGRLLGTCGVEDIDPLATKWKRLYAAMAQRQDHDGSSDRVLAFIRHALDPAQYVGKAALFQQRRLRVNTVLVLCGLECREDGRFGRVERASTLAEAERRAHRLSAALSSRSVHADVLASCRAELLQDNCFHAVLEAMKGVAEKLRRLSGLTSDGALVVDGALSGQCPRLRINAYRTDSEKSEQAGFANLLKGLFGTFRNPTAHEERRAWPMPEEDALDLFSIASYAHRRLDTSRRGQ